jgi:hypothetical protein
MRPIQTRKAIRDLKRLCRQHGIEVIEDRARGKGSHHGLIFRDPKTNESVLLVIPSQKEISPGVQREVLKYVASIGIHVAVAEIVQEILRRLFG